MNRLKNGGSVLTKEYFDHLLEQIREIRMSERKFYQKITDIYATALDYDKSAKTTRLVFFRGTEQTPLGDPPSYCGGVDRGASQR